MQLRNETKIIFQSIQHWLMYQYKIECQCLLSYHYAQLYAMHLAMYVSYKGYM